MDDRSLYATILVMQASWDVERVELLCARAINGALTVMGRRLVVPDRRRS